MTLPRLIAGPILVLAALVICPAPAHAEVFRSLHHLVSVESQKLAGDSRQYELQVRDGRSRELLTSFRVVTNGRIPSQATSDAGAATYGVSIVSFGDWCLIDFTASEGGEIVDSMRTGMHSGPKPKRKGPTASLRTGSDVNAPALLRRVEPGYTADARAAGAAGNVVLEAVIDRGGFVRDVRVLVPMGHGLTEAAVEAVEQWQFAPTIVDRIPAQVVHEITIEFRP